MARYVERADNVARFIDVNLQLMMDLPADAANQWRPLVETSGDRKVFLKSYGEATPSNVIHFLTFDEQNRNSILSCVRTARENARSVRETISSEMWEQINGLYLLMQAERTDPTGHALANFYRVIRRECHLFQGITDVTMTHNEAWNFIRLGRKLERADKTTRLLDVKYFILLPAVSDIGTPFDDIQWSAVLRSVSGFEMYRQRHGLIVPSRIVEFLLLDDQFPRAVRYCIECADESLHAITGTPSGRFSCATEQRLGRLRSALNFERVDAILAGGLHEFVDELQAKANTIDECILDDFFEQRHQTALAAS
jgi:uncharacterized alpha-E superfamily protein